MAEAHVLSAPLSVVVVDDHPAMRLGLKSTLSSAPQLRVVDEAEDGLAALRVVRERRPDLVVLDMLLPQLNGLDVLRALRPELPELKFVAYSRREDPWFVQEALSAGALGYVFKRSAPEELIHAISRAARGRSYVDPALQLDRGAKPEAALSQREEQVLRIVANGAIAHQAAKILGLSHRTFETYKARAMQKLQLRTRVDLMRFAEHCGWLKSEEAEERHRS